MPSPANTMETWNRKLHYYLGLYFLFFLWLFALTGLMLNHQQWFSTLYERQETAYERSIEIPRGDTRSDQALDLAKQLGLRGELEWPRAQATGHFDFNVVRPTGAIQVRADLNAKRAYIKKLENGALHTFQVFHTFSGTRFNQPSNQRDWVVTQLWVMAMDALAAGLIVMVLGSYYMWWRLKKVKILGIAALGAGFAACSVFVFGVL